METTTAPDNPMLDSRTPAFLLLGESVVDMISTDVVHSLEEVQEFRRYPGGQVANLSVNLAKLGFPAYLGTCLGDDDNGDFLLNTFQEAGIELGCIQTTTQSPTTVVAITRSSETPDFNIDRGADQLLQKTDALSLAASKATAVHTSAFALSRDPARSTILTLLKQFHLAGRLISLDPNYHPEISPDREDFLSYLLALFSLVTVLKPSIEDSQRIFGPGLSPDEYLNKFLDYGPEIVILTLGREGSLLGTHQGEYYQILPNQVPILDATGAGDAYWSGLLIGLLSGLEPIKAACLGQSIAEHKISVIGPLSDFHSLDYYLDQAQNIQIT